MITSNCPECEIIKEQRRNRELDETKRIAEIYAKKEKLQKVTIYQRENGTYSYCADIIPEAGIRIEIMFINP